MKEWSALVAKPDPAVPLSIDVVIPTHDGWYLTRQCLEHLARQTRAHTVILVDNGSTDGTLADVGASFPTTTVLALDTNVGFARACNSGARAGRGDVIVLLNNDVEFPPEFLERLVAPLESNVALGSAAAVLVVPGAETIDSAGLTADRTLAGFPRLRGRPVAEAWSAAPVLTGPAGAAAAYRRSAWEQVGGLDEGVFMYSEDLDLALRLRAAGWNTALAHSAVAVHLGSASIGHRSVWQRFHGGFARGYFLRRYRLCRARALRAVATEAIVVAGDAVLSRDLAALRGRVAGWRAAAGLPQHPPPPPSALDGHLSFRESLRLRRQAYGGAPSTTSSKTPRA